MYNPINLSTVLVHLPVNPQRIHVAQGTFRFRHIEYDEREYLIYVRCL